MAQQYFVYKPHFIPNVGGVMPTPPVNGHLGLAVYEGWFLGVVDTSEISWFGGQKDNVIVQCSNEEGVGFKFLGVTQVMDENAPEGEAGMPVMRDLTADELNLKQVAQTFFNNLPK